MNTIPDYVKRGLLAGLYATLIMTVLMIAPSVMTIPGMERPIPLVIVSTIFGTTGVANMMLTVSCHLIYGSLWGLAFSGIFRDKGVGSGLSLSLIPWVILILVFFPLVNRNFFYSAVKPAIAAATLIMHLIYGGALAKFNRKLLRKYPGL
ncbi:hypothetical protein L0222_11870 [bacterium]|nr:hypothetical protein [bacterium]